MKVLLRCVLLFLLGSAGAVRAQTSLSLSPLTSFGSRSDGTIQPLDVPWVDAGFNQRGMAFDPRTGNLVFVDTHSGSGGSSNVQGAIYIIDGTSGNNLTSLDTTGMNGGGSFADSPAAVAEDGVVYVANMVNNSTSQTLTIYRWDSTSSTAPPVTAFSAFLAPAERYGTSMDVRGAGTNTQIIMGSMAVNGTPGTNVLVFTTADGTNFSATVLGTDATSPNFSDGLSFGVGNTFWAKNVGAPLRLMSFDLTTSNAVTVKSFDPTAFPEGANLGPVDVDNTNHLLAAIEEAGGTTTGGPERVRLYDISNPDQPPQLLDVEDYQPNNGNATAPIGYIAFGGSNVYAYVVNNGFAAFSLLSQATPAPTITAQPAPNYRVVAGRTISFVVSAYPLVAYQWQSNTVDIQGATNGTLTLVNVQTNYSGTYTCKVSNSGGSASASTDLLVVSPASFYHLNLQWSVAPGAQPFMNNQNSSVPNQRTIAYNALSNHLYVVTRSSNTTSNYMVYVLDASNGAVLSTLNTNGIFNAGAVGSGGIGLDGIGVADDGAIYICNETPNAYGTGGTDPTSLFRIYRWADDNSNTLPVEVFEGEPSSDSSANRWGDALTVRGGGTNTQILIDQNAGAGTFSRKAAILAPTDQYLTNFAYRWFFTTNSGGSIGRSLQFDGSANNIWQKHRAGNLVKTSFDPSVDQGGGEIGFANAANYSNFTNTLCGVSLDFSRNLAAGVNITGTGATTPADTLDLYDISDLNAPLLLVQYNFPANPHNPNANFITQTIMTGGKLFTLDANNGLMSFSVLAGPPAAPGFLAEPQNLRLILGGTGALSAQVDQQAAFQWQMEGTNLPNATNATLTIAGAQVTDAGQYRVIASNAYGSATSAVATVTVVLPQNEYSLSPLWSLAPLSRPYLGADTSANGSTPLYRSLAYNSLSNQLYVISRTNASSGLTVQVLDGTSGADLYTLNTDPISGGSIVLLAMGVAANGALYAANMDTTGAYALYRWANSDSGTVPVLVFQGEPANQSAPLRWGDTMDVRGGGLGTQVAIDSFQGTYAAILSPTDSSMNVFTNAWFAQTGPSSPIGRSLQFGENNRIWQKRSGGSLRLSSFDLAAQSSIVLSNFNNFPSSLGPVALDLARGLVAGINFAPNTNSPDALALYDISDLTAPLLIATYDFPTNARPNANLIGQVLFAGNRVYAVDGNNGIVAFTLNAPGVTAPALGIARAGADVVISWPLISGYTLQATPSLSDSQINWTNVGPGTVVNGQYVVTNTPSAAALFYRLKQ